MFDAEFEREAEEFTAEFSESAGSASRLRFGIGLSYDPDTGMLSVDTADGISENDKRPVSSAALWAELDVIETLLRSI